MAETDVSLGTLAADDGQDAKASSQVVVKCTALTKIFRDFWMRNRVRAVEALDLEVTRGQVFGLLGPNGSGKSTTIKIILGLLHATSGRVMVFGKRPDDVAIKSIIGYLPEESYLYRFLNARETLDYYGRLFHLNRAQRHDRIDTLLHMVGLDAVQRRPVGEYSKGMQRRIGLAQALINDPQLLILDEPTTGLDPIGTRQIKDLILTLKNRGKTILLCSHLLADVEDVCDRVAVMYGGKIQRMSSVDELLTEEGATILRTDKLDADTIAAIDELLTRRGKHIEKVEQPRQKLESLFLDIVHQAQQEGRATSGATSGGRIADFLSSGARDAHLPESVEPEQLLRELAGQSDEVDAAAAAETAATEEADKQEAAVEPAVEESVIDGLVAGKKLAAAAQADAGGDQIEQTAEAAPPDKPEKPDEEFLQALMDVPEEVESKKPQSDGRDDSGS